MLAERSHGIVTLRARSLSLSPPRGQGRKCDTTPAAQLNCRVCFFFFFNSFLLTGRMNPALLINNLLKKEKKKKSSFCCIKIKPTAAQHTTRLDQMS